MGNLLYFLFQDIIARLAMSSSESDSSSVSDENIVELNFSIVEENCHVDFTEDLQAFQDTLPKNMRHKRLRRQKKKPKKEGKNINLK